MTDKVTRAYLLKDQTASSMQQHGRLLNPQHECNHVPGKHHKVVEDKDLSTQYKDNLVSDKLVIV